MCRPPALGEFLLGRQPAAYTAGSSCVGLRPETLLIAIYWPHTPPELDLSAYGLVLSEMGHWGPYRLRRKVSRSSRSGWESG